MKRIKLVLSASIVIILFSLVASAQEVKAMKLVTAQSGWAQRGRHLYWTTDAGSHWKDIVPLMASEEELSGTFFLNASLGWIVFSHPNDNGEQQFRIAVTGDSGQSWSSSKIDVPAQRYANDLSGGAAVFFIDSMNGWINLHATHGLIPAGAVLLATRDGGKTWEATPSNPGWAGISFCFFNETDGVLAGGGAEETEVWVTHNGSKSWHLLELKPPREVTTTTFPSFDAPVCQDRKRGYLPVNFSASDGITSHLVLFTTDDGGETWKPDRTLPTTDINAQGQRVPAAVAGSSLVVANSVGDKAGFASVASNGHVRRTKVMEDLRNTINLSFIDDMHGWATTVTGMYSSSDGGATWTDIMPPDKRGFTRRPPLPKRKPTAMMRGLKVPDSSTLNATSFTRTNSGSGTWKEARLGFDRGQAPTVSQMNTWWNYSPYYDYQISLAGAANHATNQFLTDPKVPWVSAVESQGWGLWTLWVGPQAPATVNGQPCLDSPNRLALMDPSQQAYPQGQSEASKAIAALQKQLALGGTLGNIIYYDIENYATGNAACATFVEAFLNGWISGLQSNGYKAGIYGNIAPAALNFSQLSPLPDDVWITLTPASTSPPSVTVWNLASKKPVVALCDPYSASPCNLWSAHQRIHQYLVSSMETWGNVTFTKGIDSDIIDSDVAWSSTGTKIFNYSVDTFSENGNQDYAYAINNIGSNSTYGGFINASPSDVNSNFGQVLVFNGLFGGGFTDFSYSLYDWGTPLATQEPPYPQLGNCYGTQTHHCTQMSGMNNAGWIVGTWTDLNGINHGFLNKAGSLLSFDNPNAITGNGNGTSATSINDAGLITGYYYDANGYHGFIYNAVSQQFVGGPLDAPGSLGETIPLGINGDAQIVGWFYDGANTKGFLYSNGTFTSMPATCGASPVPVSINDNSQIVGYFDPNGLASGNFFTDNSGVSCSAFNAFTPYAINDAGQISGYVQNGTSIAATMAVPQTP